MVDTGHLQDIIPSWLFKNPFHLCPTNGRSNPDGPDILENTADCISIKNKWNSKMSSLFPRTQTTTSHEKGEKAIKSLSPIDSNLWNLEIKTAQPNMSKKIYPKNSICRQCTTSIKISRKKGTHFFRKIVDLIKRWQSRAKSLTIRHRQTLVVMKNQILHISKNPSEIWQR